MTKNFKKTNAKIDSNELFKELISKQLKNVPVNKKLQYTDIKRICKYINSSIFDEKHCCIWNGYITNANNSNKGTYINFYFRKKKAALHRLLYLNFVGSLTKDEYIKFSCENKGKCCNIMHLQKFMFNKKSEFNENKIQYRKKKSKTIKIIGKDFTNNVSKKDLTICFN